MSFILNHFLKTLSTAPTMQNFLASQDISNLTEVTKPTIALNFEPP